MLQVIFFEYCIKMAICIYLQKTYNIESPSVALLNVGVEEEKGDMLRKETYQILKNSKRMR